MDRRSLGGRLIYLPTESAGADPEAFLRDVLSGWRKAQLAQGFKSDGADRRERLIFRVMDFIGAPPWQWTPRDADDFFAHQRGVKNLARSTVRAYQSDIKLFFE